MGDELRGELRIDLRIDWSDMDLFGHVNNVAIQRYVQAARMHALESTGISAHFEAHRQGPLLARTECNFRRPLFYPGAVSIDTSLAFIKRSSFGYHHVLRDADGGVVAEADDVIVMYDYVRKCVIPFPDHLKPARA